MSVMSGSLLLEPELFGSQTPTHLLLPQDIAYSDAAAAIELYESVGPTLFEWQRQEFEYILGRRFMPNGTTKWACYESALELSRQNGKSVIFEGRALVGIYVFRETSIVYSTHTGEASTNAYNRILALIESDPELRSEMKQPYGSAGREAIIFKSRKDKDGKDLPEQMIRFRTRTPGGGRSLSADCLIVDEAQGARFEHMAAVMPLMSARTILGDPQILYGGSAGDEESEVLGRLVKRTTDELELRKRGLFSPRNARLHMARWAADLDVDDPADPRVWARTNPLVGHLMSIEGIEAEYETMGAAVDPKHFAGERLGVGSYPREDGEEWAIPKHFVEAAADDGPGGMVGPVMFSLEVEWNRQSASIVAVGVRADGTKVAEVIASEIGTLWTVERLKRLTREHENFGVAVDPQSPAKSLLAPLKDAGVPVVQLTFGDVIAGWGSLYDALTVDPPQLRLRLGLVMLSAFAAASVRDVSGSKTWKRTTSSDSTAVIALTWAAHMYDQLANTIKLPGALPRTTSSGTATRSGFDVMTAKF